MVVSSFRFAAAFGLLLTLSVSAQAPSDLRVALVIGNAAYPGNAALTNPGNDALAMANAFRTLGFKVTLLRDGSHAQMRNAIAQTRESLKNRQGIGVLYFAGHGVQMDAHNYMVPVDAKLKTSGDIPGQTIDVAQVIEAFKAAGNRMNILILDACRDNPFDARETPPGLASIDAPSGTFLAYATAPGNVAEDGDMANGNGLYTGYLVKELQKPAIRIEDVFKRVRLQVRQRSKGRQIPWESTSLEEDFYFNDGGKHTFAQHDLKILVDAAAVREQQLRAALEEQVDGERKRAAAEALTKFTSEEAQRLKDQQAAQAQAEELERRKRMSASRARDERFSVEKTSWDRIKDSKSADDFYDFLKRYPAGFMTEQAQFRLDAMQRRLTKEVPGPDGIVRLPPGTRRYMAGDQFTYLITDGFTKIQRTSKLSVASADEVTVVMSNGGIRDQMGSISKHRNGVSEPAIVQTPADIFVGKKWRTAFINTFIDGTVTRNFWDFKVVALEELKVPAGTIRAFKVEGTGEAVGSTGLTTLKITVWVDPATMLDIRTETLFRFGSQITEWRTVELVAAKQVPR